MWIKGTGMRSRLQFQPTSSRKTLIMPPISRVCWSLAVFAVRSLGMHLKMEGLVSQLSLAKRAQPQAHKAPPHPHEQINHSHLLGGHGQARNLLLWSGISWDGWTEKGKNRVCNRKRRWESECTRARGSWWEASHLINSSDKFVPGTLSSAGWGSKNKILKEKEEGRARGL